MLKLKNGFTLIELLVVVAIIGILAAITIPGLAARRAKHYDSRAEQACHHAATAEVAYHVDHGAYTANVKDLVDFMPSITDVNITITTDDDSFVIACDSFLGTDEYSCFWHSDPDPGESNMFCGDAAAHTRRAMSKAVIH